MTPIEAIVLGVVEGITEFLPISSTGHMIMAASIMGLAQTEFVKSFEIVIQLGAILAVLAVSWKRLALDRKTLVRVLSAFLPTAVIGLALYKVLKSILLGNPAVVAISLFLGGVLLILFEKFHRPKIQQHEDLGSMPIGHAVTIGLAQSVAIIPGVSRSAATIVAGMALGWSRSAVVEFSFLLAVPTMLAASGLDLLKSGFRYSSAEYGLMALGFIVAFVTAHFVIRWFLAYVRTHSFTAFGIYRIIIAAVFWWTMVK
jgi:undecaprenyl-diphosphatase